MGVVYEDAGCSEWDPPGAVALARGYFGDHAVEVLPRDAVGGACTSRMTERGVRIRVASDQADEWANWRVAIEIARWVAPQMGYEQRLNLAAELCAPSEPFAAMADALGRDVHALADAWRVPCGTAALRLGEVCGIEVALVTPTGVYCRGERRRLPPDPERIRLWAERSIIPCGFVRHRVHGDGDERTAFVAA